MQDFKLTNNSFSASFFHSHDFAEGEDRLCWTMAGLYKLIALGLWRREFDQRGNLKSKPLTVEAAMKLSGAEGIVRSRERLGHAAHEDIFSTSLMARH
jgi:hypothetical protein